MILFRYVIRDYFRFVVGTVVLCLFLFVMMDFIHKSTKYFAEHKPAAWVVFQYYFFQIPPLVLQALPIASLLASVVTMVMFSRTNEITAMRAAGMGPLRVGLPIGVGALTLCCISFTIGEWIAPFAVQRTKYIESVLIEGKESPRIGSSLGWIKKDQTLFHFRDYEPITGSLQSIRMIETGANFRPRLIREAPRAFFRPDLNAWRMEDVQLVYFQNSGGFLRSEYRKEELVEIPIEPSKINRDRRDPVEMSMRELWDIVDRGENSGIDITKYRMELHMKFAFHFAALVVSLIGLKFGYRSERTVETARSVLMAVGVGLGYWFILTAGKTLGMQGITSAVFGAWLPNLVISAFGIVVVWLEISKK